MKKLFVLLAMLICSGLVFAQDVASTFEYDEEYEEMLEYGEYEDVIEDISTHEQPYSAVDNYYMGIAHFALEDFDAASEYLAKAVEMLPEFLEARDTICLP